MTPKQLKFARLVFEHGNATQAYKASYSVDNMKETTITNAASELLENPDIRAYLEEMKLDAQYVAQLNVAWVVKRYMQIATADVNELVEARRVCCRHCHGIDHAYQWLDVNEWATKFAEVIEQNAGIEKRNARTRLEPQPLIPLPSDAGGFGYWGTNPPHSECPTCFGNGTLDIFVHDSRKLKGSAKLLYAGIKQSANGLEIKTRDQDAALAWLAKFLGIDNKSLDLKNINPGEAPAQLTNATTDPNEAAKVYASIMQGAAP
jgi:phage terminase small subunit